MGIAALARRMVGLFIAQLQSSCKRAQGLRMGATTGVFREAGHGRAADPHQFSYSHSFDNKIYIAKQQKPLDPPLGHGRIGTVLGVFTDIGTHPPKPPPLVELQRNPPGLRFFLCYRCGGAA
jgi:hypothetical protein